jgi:hypothetical protein
MRITLTPEQSACWLTGGEAAWRLEEDYLEMATAQGIAEPVVVALDTGEVAFAFSLGGDQ